MQTIGELEYYHHPEIEPKDEINENTSILTRELALIKIRIETARERREAIEYTTIFKGRVIDISHNSMVVEITGAPEKITAFIKMMEQYRILEVAISNPATLVREARPLKSRVLGM